MAVTSVGGTNDRRGHLVRVKDVNGRVVEGIIVKDYEDAIFMKVLRESCDYPKTSWSRYGIKEKEGTFILGESIKSLQVLAKPSSSIINEGMSHHKMERFTVRDGDNDIHFVLVESEDRGSYGYFTTSNTKDGDSKSALVEAVKWAKYNMVTEGFTDSRSALHGVMKIKGGESGE